MRFLSLVAACIFVLSGITLAHAQDNAPVPVNQMKDTIYLMNGETLATTVLDTSFFGVKVLRPGKNREMIIEGERIFSYKLANGFEKIVYFQDTMIGNEFSVAETRQFLIGERDAQKGYHSRLWPAGNIIIGVASAGLMNNVLAFIPPFAYAAGSLIPRVTIKHNTVSDLSLLKSDTYILGYERVARKRRTLQSFVGGVVGLGVGFLARSVYNSVN
jgi:hypothetical protein